MRGPPLSTAPAPPSCPPGPGPSAGRRRPWLYAGIGVVLATVLAVVLFAGVGAGGPGGATSGGGAGGGAAGGVSLEPGVNAATSLLLSLNALPDQPARRAPDFRLIDQHGRPLSVSAFRGKVVVLSVNDDQCQDLCTLLANDIIVANQDLGRAAKDVVWLSVNANPFYPDVASVAAWTDQHGLGTQPNWYFGTAAQGVLAQVWRAYGIEVDLDAQARTVSHGTEMFFIDPQGDERAVTEFGTTAANTALFAHGLAQVADDLLPPRRRVRVGGPETPVPSAVNATVGAVARGFRLPYLAGGSGRFALASLRGRYAVVNFWSSTCPVCRVELPQLEAVYRSTRGRVAFVGVDVSDQAAAGRATAGAARLTYPLVADVQGSAAGSEQVTGLPFTIILDPSGRVLIRHPGSFTTEQLQFILDSVDAGLAGGQG